MRRPLVLFLTALTVGACASVEPVTEGPTPTEQPARPAEAPEPPEPEQATEPTPEPPSRAPDAWWLLDVDAAGVHGIGARRAYDELLAGRSPARTVVVAVIDGGVDAAHEDLDDNLWINGDEVPGNGVDDDGNGYVDDVHGWNFIGGTDGRNVHHDTFEVTRLHAACTGRDAAADAIRPEAERCDEIESAYEAERREAEGMLRQLRQMSRVVDRVNAVLRRHLGVDSLTVERVRAISTFRSDVRQARAVYLQLADNGITPAMIDDERSTLEDRVEYGFDPSYDPRPIVGDDYADASERRYGNADVEGPDADHGTHVAGIVGAERGNGLGVDGVASAVELMVVRAVPNGDERDKDVANAIRYAADNGADVINMSFGKAFSPRKDVVDAAVRHAEEAGVLFVHAAGNDGADLTTEPSFPTRFFEDGDSARHWIEVGASSWRGPEQLAAPFSNYGRSEVHVFAPGMDIRSTVPGDGYEANSGTSMAAPVVSGLAALLMAYYPELAAGDVKRIILDSATRHADQSVVRPGDGDGRVPFGELAATGGIVNAFEAIRMAERMAGGR